MLQILNAEPDNYCDEARAILRSLGSLEEREFSRSELIARLPDVDVLIVRLQHQIDRTVIEAGRRLKAIVTATTGLDHIDCRFAAEQGIAVLSLRGELEFLRSIPASGEHTWALLLALTRHIPEAVASTIRGSWVRDDYRGNDLNGRRLGILGLGRIGERVARYAQAFGMEVVAYDPYRESWPEGVRRVETMEALLEQAQVLSIHVSLSAETENLIGERELGRLPKGAILVNTARGDLLDETALVNALTSGHLAGAALDVIRNERNDTLRNEGPVLTYARAHSNLLVSPHIGGATIESMAATEVFMARKLAQYLRDHHLKPSG